MSREKVFAYHLGLVPIHGLFRAVTNCRCCHQVISSQGPGSAFFVCESCFEWLDGAKGRYDQLEEMLEGAKEDYDSLLDEMHNQIYYGGNE